MSIELAILIAGIIGIWVGLAIGRNGRRERDRRISELERENSVNRNVMDAQNDTIGRLRRKLKKDDGTKEN